MVSIATSKKEVLKIDRPDRASVSDRLLQAGF